MPDEKSASAPRIFLSAGETSGDRHAANFIRAALKMRPRAQFSALGGGSMQAAGARLLHNMLGRFSIMGFADIPTVLPAIKRVRDDALDFLDSWRPDAAVLVDYPGFNLNLARHLKKRSIPVFYYICPQVWAWAPWRIRKIARRVDMALVVFPFEEELYAHAGIPVQYVGHPLGDLLAGYSLDRDFIVRGPLAGAPFLVSLLPGSREREIERGFPIKAAAAGIIKQARPDAVFAVPVTTDAHARIVRRIAAASGFDSSVFVGRTYEVMGMSSFALATSGTATLELAHFGVPMVVLYRTNPGGLLLKKTLLTTPHVALVNIVAGRRVVPELVYFQDRSDSIAEMALDIIADPARLETVRRDVRAAGALIDAPGASENAARAVLERI